MKKLIITITGATGSGKSTLEKNLQEQFSNNYKKVVSCTTRAPRAGEVDGKDYYFMSPEQFDSTEMIERVEFAGNKYGVPAFEFDTDKDAIIVVEPGGAQQISEYVKNHMPDREHVKIFMDIPKKVCHENIRKSTPPEEAEKRIAREDNIKEDWEAAGLVADLQIKRLTDDLHLTVQEWLTLKKIS